MPGASRVLTVKASRVAAREFIEASPWLGARSIHDDAPTASRAGSVGIGPEPLSLLLRSQRLMTTDSDLPS
jgi:hypothetical protein